MKCSHLVTQHQKISRRHDTALVELYKSVIPTLCWIASVRPQSFAKVRCPLPQVNRHGSPKLPVLYYLVILKPPPPCVSGPPQSFIILPRANDDPPHHLSFSACQHHAPKPDDDPLFCIYFPWFFLRLRCANTTISLVSSTETFFSSPDDLFFMLPEAPTAERRVSRHSCSVCFASSK